jgi:D-alanyl-D-alanine-carboxypeptidase/D-alanyl-D-alanine-endopeptidase
MRSSTLWMRCLCVSASILVCLPALAANPTPDEIEAAKAQALSWLGLVDSGRYEESWKQAAPSLRKQIPLLAWEQGQFTNRVEIGALESRKLQSAKWISPDEDAWRGDSIELKYRSDFEDSKGVEETLLFERVEDGKWLPAIYAFNGPGASSVSDARILSLLKDRIDRAKRGVGIVVGVVDEHGRRFVSYGVMDRASQRKVDADTLFEIGSITKTFTATLLADMVVRGEVKLDEPVSKYLPPTVKPLRAGGKDITLLQLATHTSGLPRLPSNMPAKDPGNPYADYTLDMLYAFLDGFDHPQPVPSAPAYSNLGFGLLGHVLGLAAKTDYQTLVRQRILEPLHMDSTEFEVPAALQDRFATGHFQSLHPSSHWAISTLAAAGALRSSARDLLTYAEAYMGLRHTPLDEAMKLARKGYDSINVQGLAWMLRGGGEIHHGGGTGGFVAFLNIDTANKRAVVVLSNSANGIEDLGRHIAHPNLPVQQLQPLEERREVRLSNPAVFDAYVGTYEFDPDRHIEVMREGDRYFGQDDRKRRYELLPLSDSTFRVKEMDAEVTFDRDDTGRVTHAMLRLLGGSQRGAKVK